MATNLDFSSITTGTNILSRLRTYSTIFTLSAVPANVLNSTSGPGNGIDLGLLKKTINTRKDLLIAKSSGKGSPESAKQKDIYAGQYDFYFDDVEITTLPAFTSKTNFTKATNISFKLIEPYSIGGLFQALAATTSAAGGLSFQGQTYALSIQFIGYPDDDDTTPITLDQNRYFLIKIVGIEVRADASGTIYEVKAVPVNEMGLAGTQRLPTNINVEGTTVGDIFLDLFAKMNSAVEQQYMKSLNIEPNSSQVDKNLFDQFEVRFPVIDKDGKITDPGIIGPDSKPVAEVNDFFKSPFIYDEARKEHDTATYGPTDSYITPSGVLVRPGTVVTKPITQNGGRSYIPPQTIKTNPSIQFANASNLYECMSAVLRDCALIRNKLSQIKDGQGLDADGNFVYFYIGVQMNATTQSYDPVNGVSPSKYIFNVMPYKVHKSRLPDTQTQALTASDMESLTKRIRRTYNYLYTGNNTEIINFNLKYNNLFFQTKPVNLGYQGKQNLFSNLRGSTANEPETDSYYLNNFVAGSPTQLSKTNQLRPIPAKVSRYTSRVEWTGENTGFLSPDPWSIAAKNVHHALLEEVNMINVEMDILGDPYFLLQGAMGNIVSVSPYVAPDSKTYPGMTTTGDADHQSSDVYIQVNVKSIKDIDSDPTSASYGMTLPDTVAQFSGVYRVIQVQSRFNGGVFTQRLQILRINSQPIDTTSVGFAVNQSAGSSDNSTPSSPTYA